MSEPKYTRPLYKQNSWSPDTHRDAAWLKRKQIYHRRSRSVTREDLDELRACMELGFGFDSPELDPKLTDTLPALEFYFAVKKQYSDSLSRSSTFTDCSEFDTTSSPGGSPSFFDSGDNPETLKTKLRQWARVVACSMGSIHRAEVTGI